MRRRLWLLGQRDDLRAALAELARQRRHPGHVQLSSSVRLASSRTIDWIEQELATGVLRVIGSM